MSTASPICAVAIPARNEAVLIGRCLTALAEQTVNPAQIAVIVLANNCDDETAAVARASHWPMQMTVAERRLAQDIAHAGTARRLAMQLAAAQSDIILTTDADCIADADWAESMISSFAGGADAVAGRVSGDWEELQHQDAAALAIGALEWEYLGLLGEAEAVFDPRPHDPAPRHAQQCGANIGITRAMLQRVGGVPALPCGEDRALLRAVDDTGGKLRHDPRPHVTASARLAGRAAGGMADALAARQSADYLCDEQFEPAHTLVARLRARQALRQRWRGASGSTFGQAWSQYLTEHTELHPACITPAQLVDESAALRCLIAEAHNA